MLRQLGRAARLYLQLGNAEEHELSIERRLHAKRDQLTRQYRDDLAGHDLEAKHQKIELLEPNPDKQHLTTQALITAVVDEHPDIKQLKAQLVQAQQRAAEARKAHAERRTPQRLST